jgi:hypothetical protein
VDLPLYVLDDPKPVRDREADREAADERRRRLLDAVEMLTDVLPRGEGGPFGTSVSIDVPVAAPSSRSSLILRRFLLVTPDEGIVLLDDWFGRVPLARAGGGTWRFVARLPEDAMPDVVVPGRAPAPPLRRIEGRLRLWASPVSVPVVLEMIPWYGSRVILELRPKDRKKKMAWLRRETYFRTAHSLLDDLRERFEHPGRTERVRTAQSDRVERASEIRDEIIL